MSISINWDALTSGPDGEALAEKIRTFIDDKFQDVTLPRFIRSVKVHTFEFGATPPELVLKDICDPLPDFYDEEDDDEGNSPTGTPSAVAATDSANTKHVDAADDQGRPVTIAETKHNQSDSAREDQGITPIEEHHVQRKKPDAALHIPEAHGTEAQASLLSRSSTPGIPGGTSNLNYFHMPLSAGLTGAVGPFAAGFAGRQNTNGFGEAHFPFNYAAQHYSQPASENSIGDTAHKRQLADTEPQNIAQSHGAGGQAGIQGSLTPIVEKEKEEASVNDVQIVCHMRYSGDVRLSLTADILVDYPMPSFVGIPLKLTVTGMTFDGVALLAYIKHKAHFCFLPPEDADALVSSQELQHSEQDEQLTTPSVGQEFHVQPTTVGSSEDAEPQKTERRPVGGLFEQIKVESEIGQKSQGRQVLKNVGNVEKFILEQVRRIFETEFVYPSFWTFLI